MFSLLKTLQVLKTTIMERASNSTLQLWQQLFTDLTSKDTYKTADLSYAYLANQLGHIALGYIVAAIVNSSSGILLPDVQVGPVIFDLGDKRIFLGIGVSVLLWTLVELAYVFKVLFLNANRLKKPVRLIIEDVSIDLLFFYLGATFMLYYVNDLCISNQTLFIVHMLIGVGMTLLTIRWYRKKIFQQFIRLPFNVSLMDCEFTIRENDLDQDPNYFLDNLKKDLIGPNHIVFYGPKGGKKTSLSVGLTLEMALRQFRCSYHTINSLISEFDTSNENLEGESYIRWSWRRADLLVIDDVMKRTDSGSEFVVSPGDFRRLANEIYPGVESNTCPFFNHKTIWILDTDSERQVQNWINSLNQLAPERIVKRIRFIGTD